MRKNYGRSRFSPRPKSIKSVRKFSGIGQFTYIEDTAGRSTTRLIDGEFAIELQNSDRFSVGVQDDYELHHACLLRGPWRANSAGRLRFHGRTHRLQPRTAAPVSGNMLLERGEFYDGTRTGLTLQPLAREPLVAGSRSSRASRSTGSICRRGSFTSQPHWLAHHLHGDAAALRQRARSVQLEHPHRQHQCAPAVGIPSGQRALHRVQRRARQRGRDRHARRCSTAPSS